MRPTLLRRLADAGKEASRDLPPLLANNPYQARKVWPPDFTRLSPQQQLRFEKKYKRRLYLSHYNPRWDKGVKMLQLGTIAGAFSFFFFLFLRPAIRFMMEMVQTHIYIHISANTLPGMGGGSQLSWVGYYFTPSSNGGVRGTSRTKR